MQCERCKAAIAESEERELNGQVLCEDCCMDLMSPAKACDPWAVYSAKSFEKSQGRSSQLNPIQVKILERLKEGLVEPVMLCNLLNVKLPELERELASLRHMEKIRGELKNGKRFIRLW
jgi:hypothetical protein